MCMGVWWVECAQRLSRPRRLVEVLFCPFWSLRALEVGFEVGLGRRFCRGRFGRAEA